MSGPRRQWAFAPLYAQPGPSLNPHCQRKQASSAPTQPLRTPDLPSLQGLLEKCSHQKHRFRSKKPSQNVIEMQSNLQKPTPNPKQAWLGELQLPPALGGASSPPLLGLRLFTPKLSLLKIATANQPITRALHFNPPFLLLCFPHWHLPEQPVSSNSSGHRPLILHLWGAGAGLVPGLTRMLRCFVARKPWAEAGRCHLPQTLPEAPAQHLCGAARVYRPDHGPKEK